ncbi:cysteine hydrolase [Cytobacillus oceanisediminis]|uniref:Cysteine hydrolase n=2 Tax=Niallia TaxID=2837506 RepID=A0A941JF42_NIACI|nr:MULTISPECIES: cysteine hydrolase family protein [Bacillaceae]MBQ6445924.1 cysteine hydrolase [Bacillus sp. (in: firmicutes)]MBZ9534583.1 cysteine hydrolase [Cytobacillus oceanisediminis]MCB5236131.1 cysteine hydrolase [Niallia circulans]NMO79098.1 cysteine hydrolase [Niallia alba]UTI42425.1 cysteine hydrolase [Niallia sp. RD1]
MENKALIVIDLQVGVQPSNTPLYNLDNVIKGVNERIQVFRELNYPIIFIQHNDQELILNTKQWNLFSELDARDTDIYINKTHANSFYNTDLNAKLLELKINTLEICGAQTEYCVDTTIRMAHGLGYSLYMKKGLTTTLNNDLLGAKTIIEHHEKLWNNRFLTFL